MPFRISMLWIMVPSGMWRSGIELPGLMSALRLATILSPTVEAVGREDVALLAVDVVEERDARGAVRIVLDRSDRGRNADLVAAPVDDAVALLVSTAAEAAGDAAVRVAPPVDGLVLEELRSGFLPGVSSLKS